MSEQVPYRDIGAGFDRSAELYDVEIEANPAMQYMRRVSLAALVSAFALGQHVLEIGCGTGVEAIELGRRGVRVLATDLSPQMLAVTKHKVAAAGLEQIIDTRQLAAGEMDILLNEYGEGAFDGAYSSFGPLNGEPDLRAVSTALAMLLRTGSRLVVSVMNRFYPFETLWYLAHGHPRQAVRRWRGKTMAGVSPSLPAIVPTWYYTPRAFARAFAPAFQPVGCRALPLLFPPPFASDLWSRYPSLVARLRRWEERLSRRQPFTALGDHFLMILECTTN